MGKEAIGIKAGKILSECDRLRNEVLPELGVRLEDKENHTVIKMVDKNELIKEMEQLKISEEKKKAEKEKKKAEAEAKKAEEEKQNKINPMEMFKDQTDKYSKFDEKGLPTHDAKGEVLSKAQIKKLRKVQEAQEKKYSEYLKSLKSEP